MRRIPSLLLCLCLTSALAAPAAAARPGKAAPYSVKRSTVLKMVDCVRQDHHGNFFISRGRVGPDLALSAGDPVLLVHGTGVNRETNYAWNYWRALPRRGLAVCWLDLPNAALSDIQISAEYVAITLDEMFDSARRPIDVIGHSQGGLSPRWAIKYFSKGRFVVDDLIMLATPNHGTVAADTFVFSCFESCWQMKTSSDFIAALNSGDETPFRTDYTSIYTASDELVQPVGTQDLEGGTNILLQDVCPGRPVDHVSIVADHVAWELVLSALKRPGGARISDVSADACTKDRMPDAAYPELSDFDADYGDGHFSDREPKLKRYAREP